MEYRKALYDVRLREAAGVGKKTVGRILAGTILYALGDQQIADDMVWLNIASLCGGGWWVEGWSASGTRDETYLANWQPKIMYSPPILGNVRISQLFGENPDNYASLGYAGHNGLDFAVPVGTPVLACAPGFVEHARVDPPGYGRYVRIRHDIDNATLIYAHLNAIVVEEGNHVKENQILGYSGNTGFSSGPHLHLDIRPFAADYNNGYGGRIDPVPYLVKRNFIWGDYLPARLKAVLNGS
jgi:murein DD-endopeptidase MepM/ murein hydrolase activator NlpD